MLIRFTTSRGLLACALFVLFSRLSAQTWNGGGPDNNFSTANNWAGGSAPVNDATASVTFANSPRSTPTLDTSYALGSLFHTADGDFTVTGANTLSVGSAIATNSTYATFKLGVPLMLTGNVAIGTAGGAIELAGPVSGSGGINFSTSSALGYGSLLLSGENTFTGPISISSGTVYLGNFSRPASGSITADVALSGAGSFSINRTGTLVFDRVISGSSSNAFAFSVSGGFSHSSLIVTLTKQQTYHGGTAVTGTLVTTLENTLPTDTALSLSSFGKLQIGANQTVGSLSGGTGSLLDTGSGYAFTANLTQNSTFGATTGSGSVALTGAYDLQMHDSWSHTGGTTITATNLIVGNGAVSRTLAGNVTNNGRVTFNNVVATNYDGNMAGTGSIRKLGTNTVILAGNTALGAGVIVEGGVLQIGNGGTTGSLSGDAVVNAGTLVFNRSNDSSYSGVISGAGALGKSGVGVLFLSGANTHTGGSALSGGTVAISNAGAFGTGVITLTGATVRTVAAVTVANNLVLSSGGTINTNGFDSTFSGVVSGSGSLTKAGTGTLVLSGVNTYTGNTSINAGTLAVAQSAALGTTGNLAFAGGTLRTDAAVGTVAKNVAISSAATINTNGFDSTFSGNFAGSGTFTKTGAGTLTLSGTSTASAATSLGQGGLTIAGDNALSTTGAFSSTAGTMLTVNANQTLTSSNVNFFAGDTSIAAGKALTLNITATSGPSLTGAWSGAGSLVKTGTGRLFVLSDNFSPASVTISSGTVQIGGNDTSGAIASDITNNASLVFYRSNDFTHGNVIAGSGTLQKAGAGVMTLTGANTYTGLTTVTEGTLRLSGDGRLATNAVVSLSSGTTLDVQGNQTLRDLSGSGATVAVATGKALTADFTTSKTVSTVTGAGSFVKTGTGSVTLTNLTVAGGTTISQGSISTGNLSGNVLNSGALTISNVSALTYADVISGSGNVNKSGAGTLTLAAANTFGGTLTLTGGRVVASAANALSGGAVTLSGGAQLEVAANQSISGLSATSSSSLVQINSGASLTVNTSTSTNITALLAGSGTFVKQGSGNMSLNSPSANTFDGQLQVQQGMLRIAGTYSFADAVVSSGGQLRGTGFIQDVAVGTGGEFSAGATLGTGTFTMSSLTLAGGSRWVVDVQNATGTAGTLNGGWDLLSISGALDFNASAGSRVILDLQTLSAPNVMGLAANFSDTSDYLWRIASANGGIADFSAAYFSVDTSDFANAFTGTFSVSQIGNDLFLNYSGGAGAIPEPSTYAMIAGAGALVLAGLRRRNAVAVKTSF